MDLYPVIESVKVPTYGINTTVNEYRCIRCAQLTYLRMCAVLAADRAIIIVYWMEYVLRSQKKNS